MQTLYSLLISILVLAAGTGAGFAFHRLWRKQSSVESQDLPVDAALGLGILSLAIFAVSSAQIVWAIPAIVLIFDVLFLIRIKRNSKAFRLRTPRGASAYLVTILLLILAVSALIPALAPPSMSDWDSLAYHLSVPKLWIEHGGIYRTDFSSHSNFPMLTEMLYMPGLILHQPVAAKLMNYWTGVLLVAMIIVLTNRYFSAKAAPLAAVGFAGMPIVLWLATTAYIDLATALYTILAVHLLLDYFDHPERRHLIGCAMAAGFAASTKMTGLIVIPLILTWLVVDRLVSEKRVFEWKRGLMFAVFALLVCSPWYVKSIIYTGSPVYPFFYSIFGGRAWSAELAKHYATQQSLFGCGHDLAAFLMLPFNLTFHSARFYDTAGLFVGPIFLVSLPILFLARYRSRKLIGLGLFLLAIVITWFMLTHQSRYLVPGFAVLAVLVASLVCDDARFGISRVALWVVFVGTAFFGVWTLYPAMTDAASVVFGKETQDEYLARTLDTYSAHQWINEYLPKDAKIALYGDTRGFYLDRDYVWADPGHNVEFTRNFSTPEELIKYLNSRKVTHALINFRFFPKRGEGTEIYYGAIDKGLFEQIYPYGDGLGCVALYEVK